MEDLEVKVEVGGDVDFGVGGGGGRRTIRMVGGEWKTAWKMMSKSSWGRRWRWVWRVVGLVLVMIPFFSLFSLADVGSLGWWKFLFLHLLLHDRIIFHGYSKKLEMQRW